MTFAQRALTWFPPLIRVVPILVACSTIGCLNGSILSTSRVFFVGTRHGHMPRAVALVNARYFTPIPAVLFVSAMTIVLILVGDNIYSLLVFSAYTDAIASVLCVIALLLLRFGRRNCVDERRVRAPFFAPLIFLPVSLILLVVSIPRDPRIFITACLIVVAGVPVYMLLVWWPRWRRASAGRRRRAGADVDGRSGGGCSARFTTLVQYLTFSTVPLSENAE